MTLPLSPLSPLINFKKSLTGLSSFSISNVVSSLPLRNSRGRSRAQTHTAPPDLAPAISTTQAAHTTQGHFISQNTPFPTISSFPPSNPHIPRLMQTTLGHIELNRHFLPTPKYSQELYLLFPFLLHPLVHLPRPHVRAGWLPVTNPIPGLEGATVLYVSHLPPKRPDACNLNHGTYWGALEHELSLQCLPPWTATCAKHHPTQLWHAPSPLPCLVPQLQTKEPQLFSAPCPLQNLTKPAPFGPLSWEIDTRGRPVHMVCSNFNDLRCNV